MKNQDLTPEVNAAQDFDNIVSINSPDAGEEFDYDFDYDPNDMYYELNGYNS